MAPCHSKGAELPKRPAAAASHVIPRADWLSLENKQVGRRDRLCTTVSLSRFPFYSRHAISSSAGAISLRVQKHGRYTPRSIYL